jgi:hypothetical protein
MALQLSVEDLLIKTPLYERFELDIKDLPTLFDLQYFNGRIDYHCVYCNKESTFEGVSPGFNVGGIHGRYFKTYAELETAFLKKTPNQVLVDKTIQCELECTRNREHKSVFIFYQYRTELIKIGQFPSVASLAEEKLKKYRSILSKEQYKELNRGIGLTSHGVGIGAFVYLRRIFEGLIMEASKEAIAIEKLNEQDFLKNRMDDKIQLLKNYLPNFLYENRSIYGILSKGVHELSENECLEYFPVLKIGIEIILDQKLETHERKKKEQEIATQLSKIKKQLS